MKHLQSLRTKIILIGLLPFLLIAYLSVSIAWNKRTEHIQAEDMNQSAIEFSHLSKLVDALQKERGRSGMYLRGTLPLDSLKKNRSNSDDMLKELRALEDSLNGKWKVASTVELADIRSAVDNRSQEVPQIIKRYTQTIQGLIKEEAKVTHGASIGALSETFFSVILLETAKENSGILRAEVAAIISSDAPFLAEKRRKIVGLQTSAESIMNSPAISISDAGKQALKNLAQEPKFVQRNQTIDHVISKMEVGQFGESPDDYWKNASFVVEAFAKIINKEMDQVVLHTKELEVAALHSTYWVVSLVIIGLFSLFGINFWMATSTTRPIARTASILYDISMGDGDLTRRLEIHTHDVNSSFRNSYPR